MEGGDEERSVGGGEEQADDGARSRKRRRRGGVGARKRVRVGGLGEVVVRVHAGLLRLQDVVVGSNVGEAGGSGAAEVRRRDECDDGRSTFSVSDGSIYTKGGSEWTREAECDGAEAGGRTEAIGRMAREELEAGLGRGRYAVGAEWDEGSMVHAMRRFGGRTIGWRFGNG